MAGRDQSLRHDSITLYSDWALDLDVNMVDLLLKHQELYHMNV